MDQEQKQSENHVIDVNTIHDNKLAEIETMNRSEEYPLELSYDDNEEYITSITGVYSDIQVLSAVDALHAIYSIKTLIGLENPTAQLVVEREDENTSGRYYTFQQYYDDVKVWMGNVIVTVNTDGKTSSLQSCIVPNCILKKAIASTTPRLSENDCMQIVKKRYREVTDVFSTLIIYTQAMGEYPILAYYCVASSKDDRSMGIVMILDASTGDVVQENTTARR